MKLFLPIVTIAISLISINGTASDKKNNSRKPDNVKYLPTGVICGEADTLQAALEELNGNFIEMDAVVQSSLGIYRTKVKEVSSPSISYSPSGKATICVTVSK